jgi:predicted unusual protein kinase regulating ubiquinone biosynthesis (AarF/ABC1/UbiB family)
MASNPEQGASEHALLRIARYGAVFAMAVAAGVTVRNRRRPQATAGPVSTTSRTARSAALAGVGAKAGGTLAVHRARRVFASAERREALDTAFELKTAEQVAQALGHMKGALMKVGQMASYLDQGMPQHVRDALASLQQDAPPMAPELAAETIERDLGRSVDALFDTWDPVPIAAASIGQVHRAMTKDGRAVAVKVQYPGVDEAIRADLGNAGMVFQAMGMLFPGLDPGPIVEEIRARLLEELDYRLEAKNQQLFVDYYAGHPFVHIPPVVDELCGARVLTTDLADGARFDEVVSWDQHERDLAGEAIYRFVFRSLYRLHAFNGDPHPGNYLFHPGGQVTFLDFGLVKRFTPADVAVFERFIDTLVLHGDVPAFRRAVEDAGFLPGGANLTDDAVVDYMGHFYEIVLHDRSVTIDDEYASESVRRYFTTTGQHGEVVKAANVPARMVIIQRINLGLYAVLGQLRATANWRKIAEEIWPLVEGPPSTALGHLEAEWQTRTGR